MLGNQWAKNFTLKKEQIEHILNLLLEQEKPMTSTTLLKAIISQKMDQDVQSLQKQYEGTLNYNPSRSYEIGQRLVFSTMEYATATVTDVRTGDNPNYGEFEVIAVEFDNPEHRGEHQREFASNLQNPHNLSDNPPEFQNPFAQLNNTNLEETLANIEADILPAFERELREKTELISLAKMWFSEDLILDVDIGTLHLAEAVLDIAGGSLSTEQIIEQIGGLGESPMELQVFSLNYALNNDDRFDEVGPTGQVLWHLKRMEPEEVREVPVQLQYTHIPYDRATLPDDFFQVEKEIGDELSPIQITGTVNATTVAIIYPHRRIGTFPLNASAQKIFPTAKTPRICINFRDKIDGEIYKGWVVHQYKYVYGLSEFYSKYHVPIGAFVTVERSEQSDTFLVSVDDYRARSEWISLLTPTDMTTIASFVNEKRGIGAKYDQLMLLGVDNIKEVDKLATEVQKQGKTLVSILKALVPNLTSLNPQETVHIKTIYSAVNVIKRCPPGAILATLLANPDFENVGGDYWYWTMNVSG